MVFVVRSVSNNPIIFCVSYEEIIMRIYRSYSRSIARKEVTRHAISWIAGEQIEYNEHYNAPYLNC